MLLGPASVDPGYRMIIIVPVRDPLAKHNILLGYHLLDFHRYRRILVSLPHRALYSALLLVLLTISVLLKALIIFL